jgi:hypothetical protein
MKMTDATDPVTDHISSNTGHFIIAARRLIGSSFGVNGVNAHIVLK